MEYAQAPKDYEDLIISKHNLWVECEEHKRSVKFLNEKLLKNEELKGQPQDVVKLNEEIGTLKSTLAKFVNGTENLDKLLRYSQCPSDRSSNEYEGKIYVHDEDTIICYFYGKVGH